MVGAICLGALTANGANGELAAGTAGADEVRWKSEPKDGVEGDFLAAKTGSLDTASLLTPNLAADEGPAAAIAPSPWLLVPLPPRRDLFEPVRHQQAVLSVRSNPLPCESLCWCPTLSTSKLFPAQVDDL